MINELLYQSIKSNNENYLNKGNNKEKVNNKSTIHLLNQNNTDFQYHNNLVNDYQLNQNKNNYEIFNYSTKIKEFKNNYDSAKNSIEKKLHNYDNEKNNQHRKPNSQSNDALHQDDFETDGDFRESGFKDRKIGMFGNKYMFNKKEYETDMNDSSINESTNLLSKSNYFK